MGSIHRNSGDTPPESTVPPAVGPALLKETDGQQPNDQTSHNEAPEAPTLQAPLPNINRANSTANAPLHLDNKRNPLVACPPPLPYTLRTRKKTIAMFWTLFFIDTNVQPLVLYYTLYYLTNLSDNLVFTVTTCTLGGVSVVEYFYRFWQLFKKGSPVRPLNARRSWLDFFQINFTAVWFILAVELIVGTVREHPPIRLLAMPLPTVLYYFGFVYLSLDVLRAYGFKAPFRISSTPKGSVMPTALYPLIEDIIAVDGGGGQVYRQALRSRYLASPMFRQMLFEMNCFWAGGAIGAATLSTILVFTLTPDAAYAVGWSLPFVWAAIWTAITIPWVQWHLRREKRAWSHLTAENRDVLGSQPYQDTVRTRFRNPSFDELARVVNPKKKSFKGSLFDTIPWSKDSKAAKKKKINEKEIDLERGPSTDLNSHHNSMDNNGEGGAHDPAFQANDPIQSVSSRT